MAALDYNINIECDQVDRCKTFTWNYAAGTTLSDGNDNLVAEEFICLLKNNTINWTLTSRDAINKLEGLRETGFTANTFVITTGNPKGAPVAGDFPTGTTLTFTGVTIDTVDDSHGWGELELVSMTGYAEDVSITDPT